MKPKKLFRRLNKKRWLPVIVLGISIVLIIIFSQIYSNKFQASGEIFTLSFSTPTNGTISVSPQKASYVLGEKVIITATPNSGYIFKKWNDGYRSAANPAQIIIGTNTTDVPGTINIGTEIAAGDKNPSSYTIEQVTNSPSYTPSDHVIFPNPTGPTPAKNTSFIQPETGNQITRTTDVKQELGVSFVPNLKPYAGMTAGYSTYTYENITGEYDIVQAMIPLSSLTGLYLYRTSDHSLVKSLILPSSSYLIGETNNLRWDRSGRPGTEYTAYFQVKSGRGKIYKQDLVSGQPAEVVIDFATANIPDQYVELESDDHMDQSADAHYRAARFYKTPYGESGWQSEWYQMVVDLYTGTVLPGRIVVNHANGERIIPNYATIDVSPEGTWATFGGATNFQCLDTESPLRFYRISNLANGITNNYVTMPDTARSVGHASWSYDSNGNEVFVYQNNCTDSMDVFNPTTQTITSTISLRELGAFVSQEGIHVQRNDNPLLGGWLLMSSYALHSDDAWSHNQIFMVEMKDMAAHPKVWRIASSYNLWSYGETCSDPYNSCYFAQAFANISYSGDHIYVGSNWGETDSLDVYRVDLPQDWHQILSNQGSITITMPDNKDVYVDKPVILAATVANQTGLSWSATGPANAVVNFSAGTSATTNFSSDLPGEYTVSLTATDGEDHSATRSMTILVHKTGDIDNKNGVNSDDFFILLSDWGTPDNPMSNVDLSADGKVDSNDFFLLLSKWG